MSRYVARTLRSHYFRRSNSDGLPYLVNDHDLNLEDIRNANIVIVGERHGHPDDMNLVFKLIDETIPDIVLVEALGEYYIPTKYKAKELYNLPEENHHYQKLTKLWLGRIVSNKQNTIYRGIELIPNDVTGDLYTLSLKEQFLLRENHWMKIIDREVARNKRVLVVVGDTHLRTIETSQLGRISPLITKFLNRSDVAIIRSQYGEIQ